MLSGNEKRYVNECLDECWITSGHFVSRFAEAFAKFCSVPFALPCSSGTSAIHLALLAHGVGPGDQVIVPSLTYISSANAVRYCGAEPVLVDVEPRTMTIDPACAARAVTDRTRGIVAVHLYGHPADMDALEKIARPRGLFIIEDAAEAHGALYRGAPAGGLSAAGTFSFYGNKIVTTGEGGMVTTRDAGLYEKMRLLMGQGMDSARRYWFPIVGYNYRMTNLQAAIGLAQMEQVDLHMAQHRAVAAWYREHLGGLAEFVELPHEESWARHAYWMFTILLRDSVRIGRDEFMSALLERGVETRPVFHPLHIMPPYYNPDAGCPVAEDLARRGISLPTHGRLTEDDVAYIAAAIREICAGGRRLAAHP